MSDLNDPLELSKVADAEQASDDASGDAPKRRRKGRKGKKGAEPQAAASEPVAAPLDAQEKVAPPPAPAQVVPQRERWVVKNKVVVSYGGQMLRLAPGKVLSSTSYDIPRLRDCGVALERVE